MTLDGALADQRRIVRALLDPRRYPHPVGMVSLVETHISFVLLAGDFAYKIKKAVDLGFLDYTRLERRRFYCAEELRLNRRLAPQLYLAALAIGGTPDAPRWSDDGEAIEYAVKMARFDERDQLDRRLERNELTAGHVDGLAAAVAAFHATIPAAGADAPFGTPEAVWAPVEANFAHLRSLDIDGHRLAGLADWSLAEFERLHATFAARKAAGRVRECHGDLHLGNMALADGKPIVFDCIEFSLDLRWIDVVSDLAFLVMDLAERGRPDYAWRLLNDWLELTGDHSGLAVLRFYQAYRALVRAKVAGLRADDPTLSADDKEAARAVASRYLDYAQQLTQDGRPFVVLTHGFSGSGKSTLARALAQGLGAVHLRSDVERKRLGRLPASGLDEGRYGEAATAATYERLAGLAAAATAAGYPVVVDAASLCRWQRRIFREQAGRASLPFLILACHAPPEILRQRVAARSAAGGDASEATVDVLARQMAGAEPLAEDESAFCLRVDSAVQGWPEVADQVRVMLGNGLGITT